MTKVLQKLPLWRPIEEPGRRDNLRMVMLPSDYMPLGVDIDVTNGAVFLYYWTSYNGPEPEKPFNVLIKVAVYCVRSGEAIPDNAIRYLGKVWGQDLHFFASI